jgi:hypothetical protein
LVGVKVGVEAPGLDLGAWVLVLCSLGLDDRSELAEFDPPVEPEVAPPDGTVAAGICSVTARCPALAAATSSARSRSTAIAPSMNSRQISAG